MKTCEHNNVTRMLRTTMDGEPLYICSDDKNPACHQTFFVVPENVEFPSWYRVRVLEQFARELNEKSKRGSILEAAATRALAKVLNKKAKAERARTISARRARMFPPPHEY